MKLDNMRLRHLRMLVALEEYKKLSLVARAFGISQPSLSRLLSELEYQAGTQLFERHHRGTALTPAGQALARYAKMMVTDFARAEDEIVAITAGSRGRVNLGSIMTPAAEIVVPALTAVLKANPGIDVNIVFDNSDSLLGRVVGRELDFSVCRYSHRLAAEGDNLEYASIGKDSLRIVAAPTHELAQSSEIDVSHLRNVDWVLQPHGTVLRTAVEAFHQEWSIIPKSVISTSSELMTLHLVVQSERIGIFPTRVAELFETHNLVRILPIESQIILPEFGLVWPRNRQLSDAAEIVLKAIRSFRPDESL